MRQKKTQKQLVTREEYIKARRKKIILYSVGLFLGLINLPQYQLSMTSSPAYSPIRITSSVVFLTLLFVSRFILGKGKAIKVGEPITRHNADLLPAEETLVRSSTEPPTDQQTQLLRAAQGGQETPQEQLLRSAQE